MVRCIVASEFKCISCGNFSKSCNQLKKSAILRVLLLCFVRFSSNLENGMSVAAHEIDEPLIEVIDRQEEFCSTRFKQFDKHDLIVAAHHETRANDHDDHNQNSQAQDFRVPHIWRASVDTLQMRNTFCAAAISITTTIFLFNPGLLLQHFDREKTSDWVISSKI